MPAFISVCALLASFVSGDFPDEPLLSVRKAVVEGYDKADHFFGVVLHLR